MQSSIKAPLRRPIALPHETYPFSLHATLSPNAHIPFDFDSFTSPLSINQPDLDCPATYPPTPHLRIVHPALDAVIIVQPISLTSVYVTVRDVLAAIHGLLATPLHHTHIPSVRRADILAYYQGYLRCNPADASLRKVHMLEGSSIFAGLVMNVPESNRILGGIDEMQALTWILFTRESGSHYPMPSYAATHAAAPAYRTPSYESAPFPNFNHNEDEWGMRHPSGSSPSSKKVRWAH